MVSLREILLRTMPVLRTDNGPTKGVTLLASILLPSSQMGFESLLLPVRMLQMWVLDLVALVVPYSSVIRTQKKVRRCTNCENRTKIQGVTVCHDKYS